MRSYSRQPDAGGLFASVRHIWNKPKSERSASPSRSRSALAHCGVAWTGYQRFMLRHIKRAGSKQLKLVPRNLHLTPYLDERDLALLSEMLPLMQEEWER